MKVKNTSQPYSLPAPGGVWTIVGTILAVFGLAFLMEKNDPPSRTTVPISIKQPSLLDQYTTHLPAEIRLTDDPHDPHFQARINYQQGLYLLRCLKGEITDSTKVIEEKKS